MLVAVIGVIGGGYAYHQVTVSKLETAVVQLEANNRTLKENQVQLQLAAETQAKALRDMEANARKSEAAMAELTQRNNELNKEKQNYMKIFKDHNLTRLARAKPGLIEKRINGGTAKVFRDLENDTKEIMALDDGERKNADGQGEQPAAGSDNGSESNLESKELPENQNN